MFYYMLVFRLTAGGMDLVEMANAAVTSERSYGVLKMSAAVGRRHKIAQTYSPSDRLQLRRLAERTRHSDRNLEEMFMTDPSESKYLFAKLFDRLTNPSE